MLERIPLPLVVGLLALAMAVLSFDGLTNAALATDAVHHRSLAYVWALSIDATWVVAGIALTRLRGGRRAVAGFALLLGLAATMFQVWHPPTWTARLVPPAGLFISLLLEMLVRDQEREQEEMRGRATDAKLWADTTVQRSDARPRIAAAAPGAVGGQLQDARQEMRARASTPAHGAHPEAPKPAQPPDSRASTSANALMRAPEHPPGAPAAPQELPARAAAGPQGAQPGDARDAHPELPGGDARSLPPRASAAPDGAHHRGNGRPGRRRKGTRRASPPKTENPYPTEEERQQRHAAATAFALAHLQQHGELPSGGDIARAANAPHPSWGRRWLAANGAQLVEEHRHAQRARMLPSR